ncbi:RNA polymerase sigma factor [Actinoplanes sp. URMC 104]|uniref:RNA polymerase sigma factor n=1 Tax=Actinoplanes sp. URMC 104 TaxID=3423409 RepID=UPI003F1BDC8B
MTAPTTTCPQRMTGTVVRAAAAGDEAAWRAVVAHYEGLVWWAVRPFRLGDEQSADVVQLTWLRLVENITKIRDPERLGGWLVRTATRLCITALRRNRHEERLDETGHAQDREGPEAFALRVEQRAVLGQALARLSPRDRDLVRLLVVDDADYDHISRTLDMPRGSIGPTRGRVLRRLRADLEDRDVRSAA